MNFLPEGEFRKKGRETTKKGQGYTLLLYTKKRKFSTIERENPGEKKGNLLGKVIEKAPENRGWKSRVLPWRT